MCWSGPDDPGRAGPGAQAPGRLRRRGVGTVGAGRSAPLGRVLPARADAGRQAQVDPAHGRAAARRQRAGAAAVRQPEPLGLAAGPPAAGHPDDRGGRPGRLDRGRHRLPQVRQRLGRGRPAVLGHARQGGQLPGRREHPRGDRPGQLPDRLAAVSARELGPGCCPAPRRPPARGGASSTQGAAGAGHARRAGRLGPCPAGGGRRCRRWGVGRAAPGPGGARAGLRGAGQGHHQRLPGGGGPQVAPYPGGGVVPARATVPRGPRWPS